MYSQSNFKCCVYGLVVSILSFFPFVVFCFAVRGGDRAAIAKCSPFISSKCRSRTKYGRRMRKTSSWTISAFTYCLLVCFYIVCIHHAPCVFVNSGVFWFRKNLPNFLLQYHSKMISVMRSFDFVCIVSSSLVFLCLGRVECIFLLSLSLNQDLYVLYIELVHQLFYNCKAWVHIVHLEFIPCLHSCLDSLDRACVLAIQGDYCYIDL